MFFNIQKYYLTLDSQSVESTWIHHFQCKQ